MDAVGVVAEYNPFHLGHEYHLKQVRNRTGEGTVIVCVLSGDFVQRGEPAAFYRLARAEMALDSGADLVVELPAMWSLRSAEGYAEAAVSILRDLKVEALSCGVETADESALREVPELLLSAAFEKAFQQNLKLRPGESYASVRQQVLRDLAGTKADLLSTPNNILAVEYRKAILKSGYEMAFFPVERTGVQHDGHSEGQVRSASQLRQMLAAGQDICPHLPEETGKIILREIRAGNGPVLLQDLEQGLLARLRERGPEDLTAAGDCDADLAERIHRAVAEKGSFEEVLSAAKTKKYALSRVRRVCMLSALGVRREDIPDRPPYIRLLAANGRGRLFLKERRKAFPELPLLAKPADAPALGETSGRMMELSSRIHDFYVLANADPRKRRCGMDYRESPLFRDPAGE